MQKDFIGNTYVNIGLYLKSKSEYDKVKSLCCIVVDYNTFDIENGDSIYCGYNFDIMDVIYEIQYFFEYNKFINDITFTNYVRCKSIRLNKLSISAIALIDKLNFDWYKCIIETIKEMESHAVYYDEILNKLIKFKGAYDVEDAYYKFLKENLSDDFYVLEDNEQFVIFDKENDFALDKFKKLYKADYESCRL